MGQAWFARRRRLYGRNRIAYNAPIVARTKFRIDNVDDDIGTVTHYFRVPALAPSILTVNSTPNLDTVLVAHADTLPRQAGSVPLSRAQTDPKLVARSLPDCSNGIGSSTIRKSSVTRTTR